MNHIALMGRCTDDPIVTYGGANNTAIAKYTLAVDRKFKRDGEQTADFVRCVEFSKGAEFAEKYFKKGTKIVVEGRLQISSYTDKDGNKRTSADVIVENHEFAESKKDSQPAPHPNDEFMNIPDSDLESLPFN